MKTPTSLSFSNHTLTHRHEAKRPAIALMVITNRKRNPIKKIYLFTFPHVPYVKSISPFSLKLECFLRMYKLPYDSIPTFYSSFSKGQMTYIRLNCEDGVEIADSNIILTFLRKKYEIDKREEGMLSSEELAVAHAFTIMLEEYTTQIGFYYRFGLHMREFSSAVNPPDWFFTFRGDNGVKTWFVGEIWTHIMQHVFRKKPTWLPYRRHSDEVKWKFSCDVKSISYYLGEKILRWRCFL